MRSAAWENCLPRAKLRAFDNDAGHGSARCAAGFMLLNSLIVLDEIPASRSSVAVPALIGAAKPRCCAIRSNVRPWAPPVAHASKCAQSTGADLACSTGTAKLRTTRIRTLLRTGDSVGRAAPGNDLLTAT